jgi:hypothetical protein
MQQVAREITLEPAFTEPKFLDGTLEGVILIDTQRHINAKTEDDVGSIIALNQSVHSHVSGLKCSRSVDVSL